MYSVFNNEANKDPSKNELSQRILRCSEGDSPEEGSLQVIKSDIKGNVPEADVSTR